MKIRFYKEEAIVGTIPYNAETMTMEIITNDIDYSKVYITDTKIGALVALEGVNVDTIEIIQDDLTIIKRIDGVYNAHYSFEMESNIPQERLTYNYSRENNNGNGAK